MRRTAHTAGGALAAVGLISIVHPDPALVVPMLLTGAVAGPLADTDMLWAKPDGRHWINWKTHLLRHRGPTHSLVAAAGTAVGFDWLCKNATLVLNEMLALLQRFDLYLALQPTWAGPMAIAWMVGYLSHLVLDLCNTSPLWLLFPLPPGHLSMWRNKWGWPEGTAREAGLEAAVCVALLAGLWLLAPQPAHELVAAVLRRWR